MPVVCTHDGINVWGLGGSRGARRIMLKPDTLYRAVGRCNLLDSYTYISVQGNLMTDKVSL